MRLKTVMLKTALVVLTLALLMTPVSAAEPDTSVNCPRYLVLSELGVNLTIDSSGQASCTGSAQAIGYRINVVVELIQADTETVLKTWSSSGTNSVLILNRPWYVPSGHMYMVKVSADVYSGTTLIESVSRISQVVNY